MCHIISTYLVLTTCAISPPFPQWKGAPGWLGCEYFCYSLHHIPQPSAIGIRGVMHHRVHSGCNLRAVLGSGSFRLPGMLFFWSWADIFQPQLDLVRPAYFHTISAKRERECCQAQRDIFFRIGMPILLAHKFRMKKNTNYCILNLVDFKLSIRHAP